MKELVVFKVFSMLWYSSFNYICSFLSGSPSFQAKSGRKPKDEDEARKTTSNRSNSALEAELKDLRERYFHMSLRYAEVEAEKEDLVMKVRSLKTNSGKGWFTRG